jgi:hypothetical protein
MTASAKQPKIMKKISSTYIATAGKVLSRIEL